MLRETFDQIVAELDTACREHYGERLVSLAIFGSVARGTMRPDSDIDLLLVVDGLPPGRMARVRDFEAAERRLDSALRAAERRGVHTTLSPVFKTPSEVDRGSPLFLDMTRQVHVLYDRGEFLKNYLEGLRRRLRALGARRVRKGGGYYWLLKPDYRPGDKIQL
jgi:predicted nucleotidyltransferase